MEKRELKYKTQVRKRSNFRFFHSAFRNPHSAMGKRGFTLIEVIILIVMAGILLPVIIVPFVTGVKSSGKPEMATKAMYLAHEEMEYRMKYNYSQSPQLDPTNFTTCQASMPSGYQCQYEILYVPSSDLNASGSLGPDTNYKRIRVRVSDPQNDTYEIYSVVTRFP